MILRSLEPAKLAIPFKLAFKHASAERRATQALWVRARSASGASGFGEGCPREYVTAESLSTAVAFVERHRKEWLAGIDSVQTLTEWVRMHESEIDSSPAAWTAVELALLDLFGKNQHSSVEGLLGLPELSGRFSYTAVIVDGSAAQFAGQLDQYRQRGFEQFKIKLARDMSENREKVRLLAEAGIAGSAVRADANNLWQDADACVADMKSLDFRFMAEEEPPGAGDWAGLDRVCEATNLPIIL